MFEFIHRQFKKQKRDGHLVLAWLERKGISSAIALETMFEFANKIERGEVWGFNKQGLSELDHAVFFAATEKQKEVQSVNSTRILQELIGKPLLEKEVYDLIDMSLEMNGIIYNSIIEEKKKRENDKQELFWLLNRLIDRFNEIEDRLTKKQILWQYIKNFFLLKVF